MEGLNPVITRNANMAWEEVRGVLKGTKRWDKAIKDFGIKLYQNNFSNNDLYTAFLGLTPEGGLFPYPNMTGSLPTPTGFEYTDILISASNDILPQDDVNKSLYKRIYHNLPYLINSKGTLLIQILIAKYYFLIC